MPYIALIVAITTAITSKGSAATITFDDLALTSSTVVGLSPTAVGSGFTMQSSNVDTGATGTIVYAEPGGANSNNAGANTGYRYLTTHNPGQELTHTLVPPIGFHFDLTSFDYHGWNNNAASTLIVEGLTASGSTVSTSFTITNTGTDPFEPALLPSSFVNLQSVTFRSPTAPVGVFQIDNIEVSASPVPEPSAPLLLLVFLTFLGLQRRPSRPQT